MTLSPFAYSLRDSFWLSLYLSLGLVMACDSTYTDPREGLTPPDPKPIEVLPIDSTSTWKFSYRSGHYACENESRRDGDIQYEYASVSGPIDSLTYLLTGEFVGTERLCCDENRMWTEADHTFTGHLKISKTARSLYFVFAPNGHIFGPVPRYVESAGDWVDLSHGHSVRDARWDVKIIEGQGIQRLAGSWDPQICFEEFYSINRLE